MALNNFQFKILNCPSSPLPTMINGAMGAGINGAGTNYVAIAGSSNAPAVSLWITPHGIVAGNGILGPNTRVQMTGITDGTSNTMMVGEHGDFLFDSGGNRVDWRGSQPHSAWMGFNRPQLPSGGGDPGDCRPFNTTTIRYAINLKRNGWVNVATRAGRHHNFSANIPLNSAHTGGVNILFGDGAVRFVTDTIPLATLQALATRDGGEPISPPGLPVV